MGDTFGKLKQEYKKLKEQGILQTDTIIEKLINNIFLADMGYGLDAKSRDDLNGHFAREWKIPIDDKPAFFYLSVLEGVDKEIEDVDIKNFLSIFKKDSYGVLTNGRTYMLLYSGFSGLKKGQVAFVLNLDLIKTTHENKKRYFQYYSKKAIFQNKTTDCFKWIAQFLIDSADNINIKNIGPYKSTLEHFFYWYAKPERNEKVDFTKVNDKDIQDYLLLCKKEKDSNSGKTVTSKKTSENSCSHIRKFYQCMFEHHHIESLNLSLSRKDTIKPIRNTIPLREAAEPDADDINTMLKELRKGKGGNRNAALFMLSAFYGFERNELSKIKWRDIHEDEEIPYIINRGREIVIPRKLAECFNRLRLEQKKLGITIDDNARVFLSIKKGFKPLSEDGINDIFKKLGKLDHGGNGLYSKISPNVLRYTLIPQMYTMGFSLEEIIYFTGIDVKNIGDYISNEKIISKYSVINRSEGLEYMQKILEKHTYINEKGR